MVEGNLRLKILPSISRTSKQTMQAPAAQEGMRTTVPKSSQGCGTTGTKWLKKRCLSSTRNPFERMRCVTREMQLNFNVLFAQVWAQDNKVPRTYDSGRWLLDKIWRCRQNSRRRALHRASLILKVPAWPISIRRRRPAIWPARIRNIIALALAAGGLAKLTPCQDSKECKGTPPSRVRCSLKALWPMHKEEPRRGVAPLKARIKQAKGVWPYVGSPIKWAVISRGEVVDVHSMDDFQETPTNPHAGKPYTRTNLKRRLPTSKDSSQDATCLSKSMR